LIFLS